MIQLGSQLKFKHQLVADLKLKIKFRTLPFGRLFGAVNSLSKSR